MISRLLQLIRERGVRGAAAAVVRRLRAMAYSHDVLIVLLKDLAAIDEPRRPGDLRLEDLGRQHLPALAELNRKRDAADSDARFAAYLDAGFHGFLAFREGELIGYYWWVDSEGQDRFPDLVELGLGIELGPGDVYGSDLYLLEEHRGGGSAGQFLYGIESGLRDRGYRRLWGYMLAENRAARWTYGVRGYESLWSVDRRRWLRWWRTRRSPWPPAGE